MIKPIGKRLLVKRDAVEEKTKSGLFLPDSSNKEVKSTAKVMAVSDSLDNDIKVGDTVYIGRYTGDKIVADGEELIIIEEKDILAVIK